MMKKTLLSLALLLCPLFMMAQETQTVAVVNTQEVLLQMPEISQMNAQLEEMMKKYEDTLVVMQEEFQTKYEEYMAESETMVEAIKLRKEQELQDLQRRIVELNDVAQQDLQKKQMELLQPIQKKLMDTINAIGDERGYSYIIDLSSVVYVGAGSIDITKDVRARLGI